MNGLTMTVYTDGMRFFCRPCAEAAETFITVHTWIQHPDEPLPYLGASCSGCGLMLHYVKEEQG